MLWSFLYLAVCRMFQLLVLRARSNERKELEILVLRHELAIVLRDRDRARRIGALLAKVAQLEGFVDLDKARAACQGRHA